MIKIKNNEYPKIKKHINIGFPLKPINKCKSMKKYFENKSTIDEKSSNKKKNNKINS